MQSNPCYRQNTEDAAISATFSGSLGALQSARSCLRESNNSHACTPGAARVPNVSKGSAADEVPQFSHTFGDARSAAPRFDDKLVLRTEVNDLTAKHIVQRYKSLADIERRFRVIESVLEIVSGLHR
jgi:hypothetical protein